MGAVPVLVVGVTGAFCGFFWRVGLAVMSRCRLRGQSRPPGSVQACILPGPHEVATHSAPFSCKFLAIFFLGKVLSAFVGMESVSGQGRPGLGLERWAAFRVDGEVLGYR